MLSHLHVPKPPRPLRASSFALRNRCTKHPFLCMTQKTLTPAPTTIKPKQCSVICYKTDTWKKPPPASVRAPICVHQRNLPHLISNAPRWASRVSLCKKLAFVSSRPSWLVCGFRQSRPRIHHHRLRPGLFLLVLQRWIDRRFTARDQGAHIKLPARE